MHIKAYIIHANMHAHILHSKKLPSQTRHARIVHDFASQWWIVDSDTLPATGAGNLLQEVISCHPFFALVLVQNEHALSSDIGGSLSRQALRMGRGLLRFPNGRHD